MNKGTGRRLFLRLFFILISTSFIFSFPFRSGAAAAVVLRITMPGSVRVADDACSLAEVADIDGPRDAAQRAGSLLLTIENGVITREQVIEALRVSGLEGVRVELQMPRTVRAEKAGEGSAGSGGQSQESSPQGARGNSGDLAELIKGLAAWAGDVEVTYQGGAPSGRLVAPASIVPGTAAATLKFRDGGGAERSLAVRLLWTQPALVLTRSLKRGDIPSERDVTVRKIRINKPGVYAAKFSEVAGKTLRRNVPQGEALALNLLIDAPIIERGKDVTIVARSGGLIIRAKGEAMESGALGETIRVRNTASRVVLSAVVTANDTVEVEMP